MESNPRIRDVSPTSSTSSSDEYSMIHVSMRKIRTMPLWLPAAINATSTRLCGFTMRSTKQ
eukprot:1535828-Prymnesium_polylepis.2